MALETYQPSTFPNARWEANRDFTVGLGQQCRDLHREIAYNRYMRCMPVLARLVDVVCNRDGCEQDVEVVLDAEMLEAMIRDELKDLCVHSRGVYKTTLRRLGETLNPSWMRQTIYKKHARTTLQPPYTPGEITDVLGWGGHGRVHQLRAAQDCGAGVRCRDDELTDEWSEVVKCRGRRTGSAHPSA